MGEIPLRSAPGIFGLRFYGLEKTLAIEFYGFEFTFRAAFA